MGADGIRAGTCNGKQVKLSFDIITTNKQLRKDEVTAMQSDLKKIGIELKPDFMPGGTFFGAYTDGGPMPTGKFDIAGFYNGLFPDPDPGETYLCEAVTNKSNPSGAGWSHLCDPKLDALSAAINASADPVARKAALDAYQQYFYDQYYMILLYSVPNVYGYSSSLVFPPSSGISGWAWDTFDWDVK
jgi:ABC-type transport system substrate-binding protein